MTIENNNLQKMLENLKVLELASVLAGPSVGQFFAELGAEVIKVENSKTGGDITRSWRLSSENLEDDRSAYFCSVNWGKKSVDIDLSSQQGKEIIYKLAEKSDVVVASYKPGDAEKLGVSYKQLKLKNDRLIYGQITGYGSDNSRVGYDAVIQAESGFMDMNGETDGDPLKMPVALIDVLAAHHLKEGLLLALLKKERTGEGSFVEVSLMQVAISSLSNQASNWLVAKSLPKRKGSLHPNIAPYGESFETNDGKRLIVAVGSDRQFIDLCELLKVNELSSDIRFSTNQKRVVNRNILKEILEGKIKQHSAKELMALIHQRKIPAGLIQNLKDVFEMKEAKEILIQSEQVVGVRNFVAKESGQEFENLQLLPPPRLGEHTESILKSLQ
jgi:crotonobetainyl-CoA:carnitine CoA-transferase CaiB-like acyl-CoA transferase